MDNNPPADDELDPLYRAVFGDPQNGTPDNITKEGCLALARLGKEAWNAWREKYPARGLRYYVWKNTADFSGFDFREESIDFQGFVFDHGARFDGAKFADDASFDDAQFGYNARFDSAQFGDRASFDGTMFGNRAYFNCARFRNCARFNVKQLGDHASFSGAKFGNEACFEGTRFGDYALFVGTRFGDHARFDVDAQFGDHASFDGAQFGKFAYFISAKFRHNASFVGVRFGNDACFQDAQFGDHTSFDGAQFGDNPSFSGAPFGNDASFDGTQFGEFAYFASAQFGNNASFAALTWGSLTNRYSNRPGGLKAAKAWAESQGLSPEAFKSIYFNGVEFAGQVNFSGRAFEGPTSFGRLNYPIKIKRRSPDGNIIEKPLPKGGQPVEFGQAPLFHNCKLHQDTTFDGAEFPPPSANSSENDTAARAYRTLKLAFAQQQAKNEEQFFFQKEMDEEVARTANSYRWLFAVYKCVSDYGFSLWRPFFLLVGTLLVFLIIYSLLADLTLCFPWQADCHIRFDLIQFTLLQASPLPGQDKWSYEIRQCLFPEQGWQSAVLALAVMFHKAISLLAVFLFGLALRNLFKMK